MFWLQRQFTASSSAAIRPLTSVVQLLSRVWLFVTPMDCSTPGFILPHYFPEFAQIYVHWVMPSKHLTLCCPLFFFSSFFPSIEGFPNESALRIRWPKYWSFSLSISLPVNIQDWFLLGWTGWISLLSKRLSRVFSSITVWRHQFFSAWSFLLFSSHIRTWLLEKP